MSKGLTITLVFDGMSMNYGEGVGNISELKKLSRSGRLYAYLSRQAIRYELYRILKDTFGMDRDKEDPLHKEQKVVQFHPDITIKDYMEADLFGYMKTKRKSKDNDGKTQTRPAVVRLSPAVALEPFMYDLEFGTNKNFADRTGADPNPFQFEHQHSLYSYTITVDMDRLGYDPNDGTTLDNATRAERLSMLLDAVKILNRDIKGRTENLNPLFAIGGVYDVKNPFFLNRIKVAYDGESGKYLIDTEPLKSTTAVKFNGEDIKSKTRIGYIKGFWHNEEEFSKVCTAVDMDGFFEHLKEEVKSHYAGA